jgi:hypothetical protein
MRLLQPWQRQPILVSWYFEGNGAKEYLTAAAVAAGAAAAVWDWSVYDRARYGS